MICKYKATIPGSKVFMREYEIISEISLYSLHSFLLNDLDFSPDQMVAFRGLNKEGRVREYGLFDMGCGTMDSVSIESTLKRGETTLEYVYDLHKNHIITLTFMEEVELVPRVSYPRLVAEKGRNPEQFADKYEDLNQMMEPVDDGGDDSSFMEEELPEGEE
jgi:hypothetical protein